MIYAPHDHQSQTELKSRMMCNECKINESIFDIGLIFLPWMCGGEVKFIFFYNNNWFWAEQLVTSFLGKAYFNVKGFEELQLTWTDSTTL